MTYRWLDDLDAALDAAGVPFVEVNEHGADYTGSPSWKVRGRPADQFQFDPAGVLCHHTASPAGTSDDADINCILWGNGSAPGPISQLYLGRTGTLYVLAAGRANHGGQGMRPGVDHWCADMNELLVGIEAGNDGVGEPWPDVQTTMYAQTVAALCLWYGWSRHQVFLHATTGPPAGGCNSKIDPAGPYQRQPDGGTWDLDVWRAFCVEQAAAPIEPGEPPMTEDEYWQRVQGVVHDTVLELFRSAEVNGYITSDAQAGAHEATLGVVRSEEYANIIRANTA